MDHKHSVGNPNLKEHLRHDVANYIPQILDLAPGGLLSSLKFDMGTYSREGLIRGRGLIEKVYILHGGLFETACFCIL